METQEKGEKVNNKTSERRQWRSSGVFIDVVTYCISFSSVSIVHFEQVKVGWGNLERVQYIM